MISTDPMNQLKFPPNFQRRWTPLSAAIMISGEIEIPIVKLHFETYVLLLPPPAPFARLGATFAHTITLFVIHHIQE